MLKRRIRASQEEIPLFDTSSPWETRGVFSDHYIRARLQRSELWRAPAESEPLRAYCEELWNKVHFGLTKGNEAKARLEFIDKVLNKLGFEFLPDTNIPTSKERKAPDYLLFADEATKASVFDKSESAQYAAALAVLEAKSLDHPLDRVSSSETPGKFPHQQIQGYLHAVTDHTGAPYFQWAILTNCSRWRLYCRDAHPDDYFEIDLVKALRSPEAFGVFLSLFSPQAFVRRSDGKCPLDDVRSQALQCQVELENNLRRRIFTILRTLANGFYTRQENHISDDELPALYENSLIFLYRLLFILYAEGKGLLPVKPSGKGSNKHYRERFSLQSLLPELKRTTDPETDKFSRLYERLLALFHLINGDQPSLNKTCDVQQYNGGLFDPKKYPKIESWVVGDHTLVQVLGGLVLSKQPSSQDETDRFDFGETIDYGDLHVRQLGSIYEGLLEHHLEKCDGRLSLATDNTERKTTGAYYTPDYIVQYIVESTLGPLCDEIAAQPEVAQAANAREQDNSFADEVLKLKVLDPAMGSGHFPVRATEYLAMRVLNHPTTSLLVTSVSPGISQEQMEIAAWRRRVVEHCIFGVDLNPLAVELAKLSLWLTCIATDKPLSFLDHHLRVGDSLVGANVAELGALPRKRRGGEVERSLFGADLAPAVATAIDALSDIENVESSTVAAVKHKEVEWSGQVLAKLEPFRMTADLWVSDFFGTAPKQGEYEKVARLLTSMPSPRSKLGKERKQVMESYREQLKESKVGPRFFHWELEFPEVFFEPSGAAKAARGFDVVVGNPPYVRQEVLGGLKEYLCYRFKSYASTADLYVYFIEQAHRMLRTDGYFGMIVSNKFMRTNYGKGLRAYLAGNSQICRIVDFGELPVFEDAATFPAIILTRNKPTTKQDFVYAPIKRLTFASLPAEVKAVGSDMNSQAISGENWALASRDELALMKKMRVAGQPLESYAHSSIYRGVLTGLNDAFVIDEATRDRLLVSDPRYKGLLKPFAVGDDVRKYVVHFCDRYLILIPKGWTDAHRRSAKDAWGWLQKQYPALAEHLAPFAKRAEARQDKGDYWWEMRACDYYDKFAAPKIVYPDIAKESRVAFDTDGLFVTNTVYFIPVADLYLLGILNSKLMFNYYKRIAAVLGDPDKGGRLRWFRQDVLRLPIRVPDVSAEKDVALRDKLIALVKVMLKLNKRLLDKGFDPDRVKVEHQIASTDKEIDALVYEIYGLTEDEIVTVEGRAK
ncbi:MAG: Eco57I restriction-modification methylase domain-containing protein [candidate division WOR-3 bacterium]|nr:Eco57I restriction-modification methylase domain-containing protein [candidate division WOR-3 bacterium]